MSSAPVAAASPAAKIGEKRGQKVLESPHLPTKKQHEQEQEEPAPAAVLPAELAFPNMTKPVPEPAPAAAAAAAASSSATPKTATISAAAPIIVEDETPANLNSETTLAISLEMKKRNAVALTCQSTKFELPFHIFLQKQSHEKKLSNLTLEQISHLFQKWRDSQQWVFSSEENPWRHLAHSECVTNAHKEAEASRRRMVDNIDKRKTNMQQAHRARMAAVPKPKKTEDVNERLRETQGSSLGEHLRAQLLRQQQEGGSRRPSNAFIIIIISELKKHLRKTNTILEPVFQHLLLSVDQLQTVLEALPTLDTTAGPTQKFANLTADHLCDFYSNCTADHGDVMSSILTKQRRSDDLKGWQKAT